MQRRTPLSVRHEGSCFCGAVGIQAFGEPIDMGFCHCQSCRTYSGATYVAFAVWPAELVEVVRGQELLGGFNKAETSHRTFCTRCGGHLFLEHPHLGVVDIRAAVLASLPLRPRVHLNYDEAVVAVSDDLPKFRDMPVEIGGSGELVPDLGLTQPVG
jgi:hypothetical protein